MARLQQSKEARLDLAEIWAYIAQDNPPAADKFVAKVSRTLQTAADFPGIGTRRNELGRSLRSIPIDRYVAIYRPTVEGIIVVRVLHGARNLPAIFKRDRPK